MNIEQEKKEIEKTIQLFFDGFDNFDASLILQAFCNDKAKMYSAREPSGKKKINETPVNYWVKIFDDVKNQPDNIWNKEKSIKNIVYIDVSGRAAQAKVEYIFSAYTYVDYYNLLKIENRWYITNKTFDTIYNE